jgi:hypothetical protein
MVRRARPRSTPRGPRPDWSCRRTGRWWWSCRGARELQEMWPRALRRRPPGRFWIVSGHIQRCRSACSASRSRTGAEPAEIAGTASTSTPLRSPPASEEELVTDVRHREERRGRGGVASRAGAEAREVHLHGERRIGEEVVFRPSATHDRGRRVLHRRAARRAADAAARVVQVGRGRVVAYSNEAKSELLGVDRT